MEKVDEKMENFKRELDSVKKNPVGILLVEKNLKNSPEWGFNRRSYIAEDNSELEETLIGIIQTEVQRRKKWSMYKRTQVSRKQ